MENILALMNDARRGDIEGSHAGKFSIEIIFAPAPYYGLVRRDIMLLSDAAIGENSKYYRHRHHGVSSEEVIGRASLTSRRGRCG